MKRLVVISDLHCGHKVGITPPDWDIVKPTPDHRSAAYRLWKMRRQCWRWLTREIEALQPIDAMIVNGDCLDGKGRKSGSTELLTADREEQAEMAIAVIKEFKAESVVMSYGTPYHTGNSEDWENQIAKSNRLNVLKIGSHDQISVNELVFDYKHFVGSSQIPHGRSTAIKREQLWNLIWSERGESPKADVTIRSHVHYFDYSGSADWLGIVTPALQAYGSKFGARKPSGVVDFGFVYFDIEGKDNFKWDRKILRFKQRARELLRL